MLSRSLKVPVILAAMVMLFFGAFSIYKEDVLQLVEGGLTGGRKIQLFGSNVLTTTNEKAGSRRGSVSNLNASATSQQVLPSETAIKLGELLNALDKGTPEALSVLQPRRLAKIKSFKEKVQPALRRQAVENTVERFDDQDWLSWKLGVASKKASAAKTYVNRIRKANQELGTYLDTASFLFHRLHASIRKGRAYDVEADFENLLERSSADLETGITKDAVFKNSLEVLRAAFVVNYMNAEKNKLGTHLSLLGSLDLAYCDDDVFNQVNLVIKRLSLDTTVRARRKVLANDKLLRVLEHFASADTKVRRSLAQLLVVGALDALESGNEVVAKRYYSKSIATAPGLRSQERLARVLDVNAPEVAESAEAPRTENPREQSRGGLFGDRANQPVARSTRSSSRQSAGGGISMFFIILLLLLAGGVFLAYKFIRARIGATSADNYYDPSSDDMFGESMDDHGAPSPDSEQGFDQESGFDAGSPLDFSADTGPEVIE